MKKQLAALIIAIFIVSPTLAFAEEVTVTVNGLVCSFCAQGIKKTFGKVESVKSVEVDLESKLVHLDTKESGKPTDQEIQTLITDAGYQVVKIERSKHD